MCHMGAWIEMNWILFRIFSLFNYYFLLPSLLPGPVRSGRWLVVPVSRPSPPNPIHWYCCTDWLQQCIWYPHSIVVGPADRKMERNVFHVVVWIGRVKLARRVGHNNYNIEYNGKESIGTALDLFDWNWMITKSVNNNNIIIKEHPHYTHWENNKLRNSQTVIDGTGQSRTLTGDNLFIYVFSPEEAISWTFNSYEKQRYSKLSPGPCRFGKPLTLSFTTRTRHLMALDTNRRKIFSLWLKERRGGTF